MYPPKSVLVDQTDPMYPVGCCAGLLRPNASTGSKGIYWRDIHLPMLFDMDPAMTALWDEPA